MWACKMITEKLELVKGLLEVGACERILWKMWACEMITKKLELVKGLLEGVSL
jgi:hypothetical protein